MQIKKWTTRSLQPRWVSKYGLYCVCFCIYPVLNCMFSVIQGAHTIFTWTFWFVWVHSCSPLISLQWDHFAFVSLMMFVLVVNASVIFMQSWKSFVLSVSTSRMYSKQIRWRTQPHQRHHLQYRGLISTSEFSLNAEKCTNLITPILSIGIVIKSESYMLLLFYDVAVRITI